MSHLATQLPSESPVPSSAGPDFAAGNKRSIAPAAGAVVGTSVLVLLVELARSGALEQYKDVLAPLIGWGPGLLVLGGFLWLAHTYAPPLIDSQRATALALQKLRELHLRHGLIVRSRAWRQIARRPLGDIYPVVLHEVLGREPVEKVVDDLVFLVEQIDEHQAGRASDRRQQRHARREKSILGVHLFSME